MYKFLLIIIICLIILLFNFEIKHYKKNNKVPKMLFSNFDKQNVPEIVKLSENYETKNEVPKIIWSYWDTEDVPEIVKLSIKTWEKNSPQYKINFMNQTNIENIISLPENWKKLPVYRQSDIIRLLLLEKYGGVWMDSSIILLEDIDKFISKNDITFFITPKSSFSNPVFENWFISVPQNNKIIKMWINEILTALSNPKEYIRKSSDYNKNIVSDCLYLICHLALKNIYEKDKKPFSGIKRYKSSETAFYYHIHTPDLKYLFKNKFDKSKLMIKLTGSNRKKIDLQYFNKSLIE